MTTLNQLTPHTDLWRTRLENAADKLDEQATIARLLAQADDPNDALAAAVDLAAARAHLEALRVEGPRASTPPTPTSKLFQRVATALREKLVAVGALLSETEQRRLGALAPRIAESLAAAERDVFDAIVDLVPHPPEVIALWIQLHLPALEERFRS